MKKTFIFICLLVFVSCSDKSNTQVSPAGYFGQYFPSVESHILKGISSPIHIAGDDISINDSGRLSYRSMSYKVDTNGMQQNIISSPGQVTGWFYPVLISGTGSAIYGTLGIFQYQSGRSWYQLYIDNPGNTFQSNLYIDSL